MKELRFVAEGVLDLGQGLVNENHADAVATEQLHGVVEDRHPLQRRGLIEKKRQWVPFIGSVLGGRTDQRGDHEAEVRGTCAKLVLGQHQIDRDPAGPQGI